MKNRYLLLVLVLLFVGGCSTILSSPPCEPGEPGWPDCEDDLGGLPMPMKRDGENCTVLTQEMIDEFDEGPNYNFTLDPTRCYILENDIDISYNYYIRYIVISEIASLDCQDNSIIGIDNLASIKMFDDSILRNCNLVNQIENSEYPTGVALFMYGNSYAENINIDGSAGDLPALALGGLLYNSSQIKNITVDGVVEGFKLYDNSIIRFGNVSVGGIDYTNLGFLMEGNSKIFDSLAQGAWLGFGMYGDSLVFNSSARNNRYSGFRSYDNATIYGSVATSNGNGFWSWGNSKIFDSFAFDNKYGFKAYGNLVDNCISINSTLVGFKSSFSGIISNSVSRNSKFVGFDAEGNSNVIDSIAYGTTGNESEQGYGFFVRNGPGSTGQHVIVENCKAYNNLRGFFVYGVSPYKLASAINITAENNSIYGVNISGHYNETYSGYANLSVGKRICNNGEFDIISHGANINGIFKTSGISGDYFGNPVIRPCVKISEGIEFAESL